MAKSAAERKRAQVARERKLVAQFGGKRLRILMYDDTLTILERVCAEQGFTGPQRLAEGLTWLVHEKDTRETGRDGSRKEEW